MLTRLRLNEKISKGHLFPLRTVVGICSALQDPSKDSLQTDESPGTVKLRSSLGEGGDKNHRMWKSTDRCGPRKASSVEQTVLENSQTFSPAKV